MANSLLPKALGTILGEVLHGARPGAAYLLNPGDAGLLDSLDRLSAEEASVMPVGGGASVAAHAAHVRYGLSLLNRWRGGEQNPWATADWTEAWHQTTVDDAAWAEVRASLRKEAEGWEGALVDALDGVGELETTAIVGSVSHLAYHLGALRQANRAARGPSATEAAAAGEGASGGQN